MVYDRVFQERNIGHTAHTAASRRLVKDSHAMDALGYQSDEVWHAFAHVCFSNSKSLCLIQSQIASNSFKSNGMICNYRRKLVASGVRFNKLEGKHEAAKCSNIPRHY